MKKEQFFITLHDVFILFLCACTGIFFAFIWDHYWVRIQLKEYPTDFPFSPAFFYLFCTVCYLFEGGAYIILSKHSKKFPYGTGITLFWLQFFLNILWLEVFFGLKFFGTALVIVFFSFMILLGAYYFFRFIKTSAAFMLLPAEALIAVTAFFNAWFFLF